MERGYLMARMNISFTPETEFNKLIGKGTATFAYRCKNCGYCEIYAPVTRQVGKDKSK
jgi:predicted nucleic-acid-binding Zn-ribbon protein